MKYLYTPFDVAVYLSSANLTISEEQSILMSLWEQRDTLICYQYRKEKRQFLNSVKHELHSLEGLLDCADELNLILREMGSKFSLGETSYEQGVIESYFKIIKLRLTYTPGTDFCKIKLRSLIGRFGYKRRTEALVECINRTLKSLGLRAFLRGWEPCGIGSVSLDDVIIIRLR